MLTCYGLPLKTGIQHLRCLTIPILLLVTHSVHPITQLHIKAYSQDPVCDSSVRPSTLLLVTLFRKPFRSLSLLRFRDEVKGLKLRTQAGELRNAQKDYIKDLEKKIRSWQANLIVPRKRPLEQE